MRYHLALIASALFSTMVAAAPTNTDDHSLKYISPVENAAKVPVLSKRDVSQQVNQEVQEQLSQVSKELVQIANKDQIDYDEFERVRAKQFEAIADIEEKLKGNGNAFKPVINYAKAFLETIETSSQIYDEAEQCDYAGSESLEHLAEIRVKTYALIFLNEKGEVMHVENLQGEIERYENEFREWQNVIQREAIPEIQRISESMTEDYHRDIQTVMDVAGDSQYAQGAQGNRNVQNTDYGSRKNCRAY